MTIVTEWSVDFKFGNDKITQLVKIAGRVTSWILLVLSVDRRLDEHFV